MTPTPLQLRWCVVQQQQQQQQQWEEELLMRWEESAAWAQVMAAIRCMH
jgi:hypothetical protein